MKHLEQELSAQRHTDAMPLLVAAEHPHLDRHHPSLAARAAPGRGVACGQAERRCLHRGSYRRLRIVPSRHALRHGAHTLLHALQALEDVAEALHEIWRRRSERPRPVDEVPEHFRLFNEGLAEIFDGVGIGLHPRERRFVKRSQSSAEAVLRFGVVPVLVSHGFVAKSRFVEGRKRLFKFALHAQGHIDSVLIKLFSCLYEVQPSATFPGELRAFVLVVPAWNPHLSRSLAMDRLESEP
mmetsp:Transcript_48366/g.135104  ORF Transcript_48366/g.135104 Transcript_48366/m.135104 type:complete len:240 (-) Transcript_48366:213-932(-)